MVSTKGKEAAARNYEGAIGLVPERFAAGVERARDVIKKSIAAEGLYAEQIRKAIANKSREKGLRAITDEDWRKAALDKGKARIGAGMLASLPKFEKKIGNVIDVIESTKLPDRTADIMQNVTNRCGGMAKALRKAKDEGKFR